LDKITAHGRLKEQLEKIKTIFRAKVKHPFRVINCQSGHVQVYCRDLAKYTAQLKSLFALSNLWMVRENYEYWMEKPA
jgi:IS5 family transposase